MGGVVIAAAWLVVLVPTAWLKQWVLVPLLIALLGPGCVAALAARAGTHVTAGTRAALTIDLAAARAGSARATVYRRWATEAELVLEAVARMSRDDVDVDRLPDTGSLRGNITAMILPLSDEEQQVRIQAVAALLSLAKTDARPAEATTGAGIGPWICRFARACLPGDRACGAGTLTWSRTNKRIVECGS